MPPSREQRWIRTCFVVAMVCNLWNAIGDMLFSSWDQHGAVYLSSQFPSVLERLPNPHWCMVLGQTAGWMYPVGCRHRFPDLSRPQTLGLLAQCSSLRCHGLCLLRHWRSAALESAIPDGAARPIAPFAGLWMLGRVYGGATNSHLEAFHGWRPARSPCVGSQLDVVVLCGVDAGDFVSENIQSLQPDAHSEPHSRDSLVSRRAVGRHCRRSCWDLGRAHPECGDGVLHVELCSDVDDGLNNI